MKVQYFASGRLIGLARAFMTLMALTIAMAGLAQAEQLTVPGSGNPEFVVRQLAIAFNASQSKHKVSVPSSTGTAGAIRDLTEGKTAIGRVGRPLKSKERDAGLTYFPLGRDPVVFMSGSAAGVQGVSRVQMVDTYSGKITNWRDLGGKPGPIRAIGREETDASRQVIDRDIKAFAHVLFHPGVKVVNLDPQLIALMDRYPTSLGFLNRSGIYAAKTKLVALELDGVAPTPENLENGRYTLSLEFGLAYKKEALTDGGREFLKFVESPQGSGILRKYGVLPPATRK